MTGNAGSKCHSPATMRDASIGAPFWPSVVTEIPRSSSHAIIGIIPQTSSSIMPIPFSRYSSRYLSRFFNVDDTHEATRKFKANGGDVVPVGGKDIQSWSEKRRNYSFLHPKKMHGIIVEFIDGAYDWKKSK